MNDRVSSFFGEELILGGFILKIIPIFLIYLIMSETLSEKKNNFLTIILISFSCFVIYLSGERTSFGLLILFFYIIFYFKKFKKINYFYNA